MSGNNDLICCVYVCNWDASLASAALFVLMIKDMLTLAVKIYNLICCNLAPKMLISQIYQMDVLFCIILLNKYNSCDKLFNTYI